MCVMMMFIVFEYCCCEIVDVDEIGIYVVVMYEDVGWEMKCV